MNTKASDMVAHVRKSGKIVSVHEYRVTYMTAKPGDRYAKVRVFPTDDVSLTTMLREAISALRRNRRRHLKDLPLGQAIIVFQSLGLLRPNDQDEPRVPLARSPASAGGVTAVLVGSSALLGIFLFGSDPNNHRDGCNSQCKPESTRE